MKLKNILIFLACGTLTSGASIMGGDPADVLAGWSPMGYFNQFYDPSNIIGPEILKTFGVPFAAYNGFNLLESVTNRPLEIPAEATSTVPPGYEDYPELFAPSTNSDSSSLKGNGAYGYGTGPMTSYPVRPPPPPPPQSPYNPYNAYGGNNNYIGNNNGYYNGGNRPFYPNPNPNTYKRDGYYKK